MEVDIIYLKYHGLIDSSLKKKFDNSCEFHNTNFCSNLLLPYTYCPVFGIC